MKNFFKNIWTKIQSWGRSQEGRINLLGVIGNVIASPFVALWNAPKVTWFIIKNTATRPADMWELISTIMVEMNTPEFGTIFGYVSYVMSLYSIMMFILGCVYLVLTVFSVAFLPAAALALSISLAMQAALLIFRLGDLHDAVLTGLYHGFGIIPSNDNYRDSANIPHGVRIANLQTTVETAEQYEEEISQQAEEILERVAEENAIDPTLLDESPEPESTNPTPAPRMSRGFANLEL